MEEEIQDPYDFDKALVKAYGAELKAGLTWRNAVQRELDQAWKGLFFRFGGTFLIVATLGHLMLLEPGLRKVIVWAYVLFLGFWCLSDMHSVSMHVKAISKANWEVSEGKMAPPASSFLTALWMANLVLCLVMLIAAIAFSFDSPMSAAFKGMFGN